MVAVLNKGKVNLRYLERLNEKVLIYDGAMGTSIQNSTTGLVFFSIPPNRLFSMALRLGPKSGGTR